MKNLSIKNHTISELIEILGDSDQGDGLHIHISHSRFEKIPITYPFRTDSFCLFLIVSGSLTLQLNLIKHTLVKNEAIIAKPQVVAHILEMNPKLSIISVSFTVDFILSNGFKKEDHDAFEFFTGNNIPKLKLSNEEMDSAVSLAKILGRNQRFSLEKLPFKQELVQSSFKLLLYHYASIYKREFPDLEASLSRQEDLMLRFLDLLNENLKNERTVKFYADVLCVTSGYLSKVLKEISGKTANQLINEAVILEAKILLNTPVLSISEIAEELQFSDQSFFGKFFKKHTGFSPTTFRKTH
ncbi:AraC family transcriptional regulator [Patiriisocius marinistellae]|uniref:AraC family transcriptional regulator n=1 Tax=Patiriisocius marinistellae TaxID=2494560 RepID=A0A5J4G1S1_9FLAO|nr:AraC family transcriptional regulator [Patiriisocius marinistellae]GEQ86435.1 AraC family transcriptional regulator [Patiriisocius marinistellae]